MQLNPNMSANFLLRMATWLDEHAKHQECGGCQRRARLLAQKCRKWAARQSKEVNSGKESPKSS